MTLTDLTDANAVLAGDRRWAIVGGDCIGLMGALAGPVDHIITDPPYDLQAHGRRTAGAKRRAGTSLPEIEDGWSFDALSDEHMHAAKAWAARHVKRWSLFCCQVEQVNAWSTKLPGKLRYMRTGIWHKPDCGPQVTGDRPRANYEAIVMLHSHNRARWNGGGAGCVWTHNVHDGRERLHETAKPILLALNLIELFTRPGEIVFDPWAGSATFGVACVRLGRRYIGCELQGRYVEIARARLDAETRGLSYSDAARGQRGLFE